MHAPRHIVIVGAGMAGARAAATLRTEGFEGDVTLVGAETARPYDRVPLSKHYLRGEPGYHPLFINDEAFAAKNGIDERLGTTAMALDPASHQVELHSGERLHYSSLLLATGARARRLDVPGGNLDGVHVLRTVADADRLRTALLAGGQVVVVGAGFIGCEVAATARVMGAEVTLVGAGHLPMERALGTQMATFYAAVHHAHDVTSIVDARVTSLKGESRVRGVELSDGRVLAADTVVVGIGADPCVELAAASGIDVDNGILTDEYLATNVPDVYAAGDVANAFHPTLGRHLRLEHWSSALNQGPTAARNMLGAHVAYDRTPFFFSDQYDVWMEFTGYAGLGEELVVRGDPSGGETAEFIAFWLHDDRVVAGMNVNIKGVPKTIAALIESGRTVDRAALGDPDVDLADL